MSTDKAVYYKAGYKYQTTKDRHASVAVRPIAPFRHDYLSLDDEGNLGIKKGYAWDGASGPTWDTKNSMRGSLFHDAGYQLIRLGYIDPGHKEYFDQLLFDMLVEDGMFEWRATYWKWAVLQFGKGSTRPSAEPQEEVAP